MLRVRPLDSSHVDFFSFGYSRFKMKVYCPINYVPFSDSLSLGHKSVFAFSTSCLEHQHIVNSVHLYLNTPVRTRISSQVLKVWQARSERHKNGALF